MFEIFVKKSTTTAAVGADLDVKRLLAGLGISAGRLEGRQGVTQR